MDKSINIEIIKKAVDSLKYGRLIIYPTETFYGIGGDAFNPEAVNSIFKVKGRSDNKPLPLIISDRGMLDLLSAEITSVALKLMDNFWPGPLTIILKVHRDLPRGVVSADNRVAVRISSNPVAVKLAQLLGRPITATSANISGDKNAIRVRDISEEVRKSVDYIIDGGELKGLKGSTIVDATVFPPVVLREGDISPDRIYSVV